MNEIKALLDMGMPELDADGFAVDAGISGRFGRTPKFYKGGGKGGSAPASTPPPPATPAPPVPVVPVIGDEQNSRRKDASALAAGRGRNALRIDRTAPNTGSSGAGLNIPN